MKMRSGRDLSGQRVCPSKRATAGGVLLVGDRRQLAAGDRCAARRRNLIINLKTAKALGDRGPDFAARSRRRGDRIGWLDESPAEQSAHHAAHYAVHRAADRADWTADTTRIASTAPSATMVLMVRFAGLRCGVH